MTSIRFFLVIASMLVFTACAAEESTIGEACLNDGECDSDQFCQMGECYWRALADSGSMDAAGDASGDSSTDAAADSAGDAPMDVPSDAPMDVPTDAPMDVPTDAPMDVPTDAPMDVPAG